jgi:hypothetical protein
MTAKKKAAKKISRQKSLPGMQDAQVTVLERAAMRYAAVRDERMDWTKKEVDAKKRVQDLMHSQKREHYLRGNIEISLEPEGEKVIVRVREHKPTPPKAREPKEPADTPPEPVEEPEPEESPAEPEPVPDAEYREVGEAEEEEEEPSPF